jgi:hypothetical protein
MTDQLDLWAAFRNGIVTMVLAIIVGFSTPLFPLLVYAVFGAIAYVIWAAIFPSWDDTFNNWCYFFTAINYMVLNGVILVLTAIFVETYGDETQLRISMFVCGTGLLGCSTFCAYVAITRYLKKFDSATVAEAPKDEKITLQIV